MDTSKQSPSGASKSWSRTVVTNSVRWLLWIVANSVGFIMGWGLGRSLALSLGGDLGGNLGIDGILNLSLPGGAVGGAVVFVAGCTAAMWALQSLAVVALLDRQNEVSEAAWLSMRMVLLAVIVLAVDGALRYARDPFDVVRQPLFTGVFAAFLIWMFWKYERGSSTAFVRAVRAAWWTFALALGVNLAVILLSQPWMARGRCVRCGGVPAAVLGAPFGALTGIALLWLLRPSRVGRTGPAF